MHLDIKMVVAEFFSVTAEFFVVPHSAEPGNPVEEGFIMLVDDRRLK